MSNSTSIFVCQQCGEDYPKWFGKCPNCGEWNSLVETAVFNKKIKGSKNSKNSSSGYVLKTVKLTEIAADKMSRIGTKLSELDRSLGGGLVPGQVVLLAGEPGIGKCVVDTTFVSTNIGLKKIWQLQPKNAQVGFTEYKIGLQSLNGCETSSHFYKSNLLPTKRFNTRMGFGLQGSYEHPLLTLSKLGEKTWTTINDLKIGDYVAVQRHGSLWGNTDTLPKFKFKTKTNAISPSFPTSLNLDMAYCLGLLVGDGGLTDFGHVNLTTKDQYVAEKFENWIESLGLKVYRPPKKDRLVINSIIFHRWLLHLGFKRNLSINKSIPDLILSSPKVIVRSFLQGLFDTDGSSNVNPKGSMPGAIQYCSASEELAKTVHLLLLQFGIVGKLRFRINNKHGAWIIDILGNNARLFYDRIKFQLLRKQIAFRLLPVKSNNNLDLVPYLPPCDINQIPNSIRSDRRYLQGIRQASYQKLRTISMYVPEIIPLLDPEFYWDKVTDIFESGVTRCYDFCIPKTHSFVTNGIVSHNSTVLLQLANKLQNVYYILGEESSNQVAIRAKRLGINNKSIQFLESTDVDDILDLLGKTQDKLSVVIVDSIQTMTTSDLSGVAGSVGQVRESAFRLIRFAKSRNIPVILVGHVTKEGAVAGPSVLMHMVDTVLWFEGDKSLTVRMLRAIKNRFGPTDEVGIFTMEDKGLVSVTDPEKLFLEDQKLNVPGSVITAVMEGTRPILVEVQGLVVPTKLPIPRRVASGFDAKRLEMILAVLTRRADISLYDMDVFVNIAGGIKAKDTGIDLAVALALASSFFDKAISSKTLAIGEVGLLGEIRQVMGQEKRIKEAKRLGYKEIVSSKDYKYLSQAIKNYLR